MQTIIYRMGKQQDPTVEHREIYSVSWDIGKEHEKECVGHLTVFVFSYTILNSWIWLDKLLGSWSPLTFRFEIDLILFLNV